MERLRNHDGRPSGGDATRRRTRSLVLRSRLHLKRLAAARFPKRIFLFFSKHPKYNPVEGGQVSEANKLFALGAAKFGKESTQAGI